MLYLGWSPGNGGLKITKEQEKMYYYNKKSSRKIIHTKECFRINNKDINDIGWFETLDEAYAKGYRLCRNCSILKKALKNQCDEIKEFTRKKRMEFFVHDKFIAISSPYGEWKLVPSRQGGHIVLYHLNEFKNEKKSSRVPGFHKQHTFFDDIMGYLRYIEDHDFYRMVNPLYIKPNKPKKTPPKGSRAYKNMQKKAAYIANKRAIANVLNIIESLNISQPVMQQAVCM